jgi:hypothetical protein
MGRHEGLADPGQRRIASLMPFGGFARSDGAGQLAVAALPIPSALAGGDRLVEIAVQGYGPGGAGLAGRLAERAAVWDDLGRPGAGRLQLGVYPAGTRLAAAAGRLVIGRSNGVLVAGWPPPP